MVPKIKHKPIQSTLNIYPKVLRLPRSDSQFSMTEENKSKKTFQGETKLFWKFQHKSQTYVPPNLDYLPSLQSKSNLKITYPLFQNKSLSYLIDPYFCGAPNLYAKFHIIFKSNRAAKVPPQILFDLARLSPKQYGLTELETLLNL